MTPKHWTAALLFAVASSGTAAANSCKVPALVSFSVVQAPILSSVVATGEGQRALAERRYEDAERLFDRDLAQAATPGARATALSNLGLAQLMLGDARRAHKHLSLAVDAGIAVGDATVVARTRYNLALLALTLSDPGEGVEYYARLFGNDPAGAAAGLFTRAAADATAANDAALEFRAQVGSIRARIAAGAIAPARAQFAALAGRRLKAEDALALADAGRRLSEAKPDVEVATATEALLAHTLSKSADVRLQSQANGTLGELKLAMGDRPAAMRAARTALMLAEAGRAEDARFRWLALVGAIHQDQGNADAALSAFESARASVERVRSNLPQFDPVTGRSLFRETVGPIYTALAGLYVNRGTVQATGTVVETGQAFLREARSTIEVLKQVEAEQFFRDECVSAALERSAAIEDVLKTERSTAAIYPIVVPGEKADRLVLLVSREGKITAAEQTIARGELRRTALRFRRTLVENSFDIDPIVQDGGQLFDWLVRPLEGAIDGADTLVFIPDGPLRLLPWAALFDRKANRYLIESHAIANSIGLALTAPRPLAGVAPRVLAGGLSADVTDPETGGGLGALQTVDKELAAISSHFPGNVRRLEGQLTKASLTNALNRESYSIVHLATHAKFRPSLRDTFLATADGQISLDNLQSLVKPTQVGGQPIELLALSACETATGNDRAALGLAGVALKAGARSVVASLWPINDDATPIFFDQFYGALAKQRLSKAKAAQRAQIALLKGDVPAFTHPHYWAPFAVIGNWQ